MRLRHLPANEYRRERWRNERGWTREIVRSRDGDDWDWRVSIAEIDHDAPFSAFPGVDRELVLLHGEGMHLHFDDGETVTLHPPHDRIRFAGERPLRAQLLAGPTHDFNLMWKRGVVEATLLHRPLVGPMVFFAEAGVTWLVHVMQGEAAVKDRASPLHLCQHDSLLLSPDPEGASRLILEGGGELLLARLQQLRP